MHRLLMMSLASLRRGVLCLGLTVLVGTVLTSCRTTPEEIPGREGVPLPEGVEMATLDFSSEVIAEGFSIPWSIAVLAGDEYLVTERMGELVYIKDGHAIELDGLPETRTIKSDRHYGGVMGVSLHPLFRDNRLVYLAYVDHDLHMVVARFTFIDQSIREFEVIFESNAFSLGSRIEWEDDSHFFVSQGAAGFPLPDPGPQDVMSDAGKVHRLMEDGSIPTDNPVFEGQSEPSSIWSYGHRDVQGLFLDRDNDVLYATEHGPLGGDELNVIKKSGNYGWPRFSHGLNYDGSIVGDLSEAEADSLSILPLKSWGTTFNIAPSSLERVSIPSIGTRFVWGSLVQQRLIAYELETGMTNIILDDVGRVRDTKQLPDGDLLILVDARESDGPNSGRLVKLTLVESQ